MSDERSSTSHVPGVQGASPDPFEVDSATGAERTRAAVSPGTVGAPGEPHEVSVPSYAAAEGTSETSDPVDGVRITAVPSRS